MKIKQKIVRQKIHDRHIDLLSGRQETKKMYEYKIFTDYLP